MEFISDFSTYQIIIQNVKVGREKSEGLVVKHAPQISPRKESFCLLFWIILNIKTYSNFLTWNISNRESALLAIRKLHLDPRDPREYSFHVCCFSSHNLLSNAYIYRQANIMVQLLDTTYKISSGELKWTKIWKSRKSMLHVVRDVYGSGRKIQMFHLTNDVNIFIFSNLCHRPGNSCL